MKKSVKDKKKYMKPLTAKIGNIVHHWDKKKVVNK